MNAHFERKRPKLVAIGLILALFSLFMVPVTVGGASGGPVVLMGIDAEDGGPGGHGPISVYQTVASSILSNVTNGGSGILVMGGGKNPSDNVSQFWSQIGSAAGQPVTFVNGAAAIAGQSFSGFALIGVASDEFNTWYGGLTQAEHDALSARQADIANHINGGGGLLGFSSDFLNPYAYLGGIGAFSVNTNLGYDNIAPTADGLAIGITDALDICCWHDEYLTFPSFLKVLATNPMSGQPAAVGGAQVIVVPPPPTGLGFERMTGGGSVDSRHSFGFNLAQDSTGLLVHLEYNDNHQGKASAKNSQPSPLQIKVNGYATNVQPVTTPNGVGVEFDISSTTRSLIPDNIRDNDVVHVRVVDNGEPGTADEFQLTIISGPNNGYSSGAPTITRGNIQAH